jgi:D-aspartate ligase
MDFLPSLGIVLSLATTVPLAWKWQLGVAKVALAVTVLGLVTGALVGLITSATPLSAWWQIAITWALTLFEALGVLAYRFYRDPERLPPDAPNVVVSPADGEVVYVRSSDGGALPVSTKHGRSFSLIELTKTPLKSEESVVVGISMSFLDVHVNRAPINGRVSFRRHFPGRFGSLRQAEMIFENERATTVIERPGLQVAVVQIASRLVRQIAVFLSEGQSVGLGERLGVIRLGSQVDVVLPKRPDVRIVVRPGDRLKAGESIIAVVDEPPPGLAAEGEEKRKEGQGAGALIIGGDYRALCIARSLGRHGIPVCVLKPHGESLASSSRYATRSLPWPLGSEAEQIAYLVSLAANKGLGGWVLFPTSDEMAALLARNSEKLSALFTLTTPSWDVVRWAYDKKLTYALAAEAGVACPRTWYPADREELAGLDLPFPVILKPSVKESDNAFTRDKAWRVDDRASLLSRYEDARLCVPPEQIMVQELVPGGGEAQFSFGALCSRGKVLAGLTARRTRQYPAEFGHSSSFVETVERPEVEQAARRAIEHIGYSGLVELEFKRDGRDGTYKLLDINPRVWTWHALGGRAGVDFPLLAWRWARGEPVPQMRGRPGVRWMRMSTDVLSAVGAVLKGRLTLRAYAASFRRPLQLALVAGDDPLPTLIALPALFLSFVRHRFFSRTSDPRLTPPKGPVSGGRVTHVSRHHAKVAGGVVMGGDYQGLGIVRSLGRQGIPVCVIDDEPSIAPLSRYATASVRVPDLRDASRAVESTLEAGRRLGLQGWVLYPTRDEIAGAFSRNRGELEKVFRVPTPAWQAVEVAWDKRMTYRMAALLGIPAPKTAYARSAADLEGIDFQYPVVVKPAIKEHFIYVTKLKALQANSKAELQDLFRQVCQVIPAEEVMLQELIPGGGENQYSYCAFFKDGEAVAKMCVRRARQHPPDFGRASTYVETLDLPELEAPSEKLLSAIGYYGLVEVEYKRDPRDGLLKILDVNPRTWGYHSIGAAAGVDFSYLLYRDQMGLPVTQCRARAGIRWIRLSTDVPTSLGETVKGRMKLGAFLQNLGRFDTESVFSRDDLRPAFAELAHLPYLYATRGGSSWARHGGKGKNGRS